MSRELPAEPWRWSATEVAGAVRERAASATEVVQSCLERIEAVNPAVNALVSVSAEEALEAATAADRAVAAGGPLGPLHGVPVSIKDNVGQAGQVNSGGIAAAAGMVAPEDAPTVRHLRAAGAIFVGRSNVPAFSLRWFSENDLYGRTLNPWSPDVTPGGSSGGAAAAVAAGMVPLAHANDIAGSIRYPAHVCGVAGLRPTVGRVAAWAPVPEMPVLPYSSATMAVQGPIARTVADLRLGLRAMERLDLSDPSCVGAPIALDDPLPEVVRVAVVRDVGLAPPSPSVERALDQAAEALRAAGVTVEEIELPQLAEAHHLWNLLAIEDLRGELGLIEQLGGEGIRRALGNHMAVAAETWGEPDLATVLDGQARRATLIHELQLLFDRYVALVLPGSAGPPAPHGADQTLDGFRALLARQWPNLAIPLLGLPAVAVATGVGDGLPEGVQLAGGRFREGRLLALAQIVEQAAGPLTPIEPRTTA
jgi:amidase